MNKLNKQLNAPILFENNLTVLRRLAKRKKNGGISNAKRKTCSIH